MKIHRFHQIHQILLLLVIPMPSMSYAQNEDISSITFPISIDLKKLSEIVNSEIPTRLADINERNLTCYEGEKFNYEYPCVSNWYKLRMCKGWTWAIPPIKCDITGYVDRRGPLSLSGSNDELRMSLPIHARISGEALLRETAEADATFFVTAVPSISENWEPDLRVEADFQWDKRPTLELFNFIDVTIGSKVEPKLRAEIDKLIEQIPTLLDNLNIREEVEILWEEIQLPIQVLADPNVYFTYSPTSVGFSGITFIENRLMAVVKIDGHTSVVLGNPPTITPVALLPLQKIEQQDAQFSLTLPTLIEENEFQAAISNRLSEGFSVSIDENGLNGQLTATDFRISMSEVSGVNITSEIVFDNRSKFLKFIDLFNWFDFSGTVSMSATPKLDIQENEITIENLRVDSNTSSSLADALVDAINLPFVRGKISNLVTYNYSEDIQEALLAANDAINVQLEDGVLISGSLDDANVQILVVQDKTIVLSFKAVGSVEARMSP